ncbi:MAG: cystathionine gamma-synthase [Gammaproteobacteria bacterium]|nr:cystathionine gamma-synthase [Gammaproteobacteria bacterium]
MKKHKLHLNTQVIHAGQMPDPTTGAVMTPIYATSTYAQHGPGEHTGFEYSRAQNPTRFAYERCVAELEGGARGFAFASGLAAEASILELLDHGDHLIASDDLYGGTFRLFDKIRARSSGLKYTLVDMSDLNALRSAIRPETKMIWVESPSNPLLKLVDLKAVAEMGQAHGILTVADNTFASPILQNPLSFGFDIVFHSATKYLNGHSDVIGGVAVVADRHDLPNRLGFLQYAIGSVASPFDSFLVLRGLKTLAVRMQRHTENAVKVAHFLENHPAIEQVYYPGLLSHPQHELATRQMKGYGGMVSIALKANFEKTAAFLKELQIFTLAESLGGVESLVCHPATMTHASIPKEQREKRGITDGFVRLSVGIEHADDLIADLDTALKKLIR